MKIAKASERLFGTTHWAPHPFRAGGRTPRRHSQHYVGPSSQKRWRTSTLIWRASLALFLCGCVTPPSPPPPATCDDRTALFIVADVLANPAHPCYAWVHTTHGRVARSSAASAVVWSLRTEAEPGVIVSAIHTLGVSYLDPPNGDVPELLVNPATQNGVPRIFLVQAQGGASDERASPLFHLYNPAIPDNENTNGFRGLLPVHDFYFGVIDDQKLSTSPVVGIGEPLRDRPPPIHDPLVRARTSPTFTTASAGDLVLLMGFPTGAPFQGRQTAGVGTVLSDEEAVAALADLAAVGDEEGGIPYEPAVEMLIMGIAAGGMSGGGVYDQDSRLLGVIVRASDERNGVQYVRAVRMTYAVQELAAAYDALPPNEQAAVAPYLELEVR